MEYKEFGDSGVGLLEPSKPVDALPQTAVIQTLPSSIENSSPVPESADSASIVARLHEFDTKRVGDDRRVRHERAKYINEIIKTQSPSILIDTASHFMSVGDDGKIKESSSLKSLRDRLVKEKGMELAASGMDKVAIVKEQVDLYKGILNKAAEDLPEDKKAHYLSKRLTPNVAAKRRTLEGRNRSKKIEALVTPNSSVTPTQEESISRRMVAEAQQPKIDTAEAALDRAKNPLPSDNPDAFFQGIREQAEKAQPQNVETAAFDRGRQNEAERLHKETDDLIQSEIEKNQAREDAAKEAFEKERAEQKAKFDAVKVETSSGYFDPSSKPDFSDKPLPTEKTNDFFTFVGEKAAKASLEQEKVDATLNRIRQEHDDKAQSEAEKTVDPLKDMREKAVRSVDAGRPVNYGDRIKLRSGIDHEKEYPTIMARTVEELKKKVEESDNTTAAGRVKRFGNKMLKTVIIAGVIYTPLKGVDMLLEDQDTSPTHSTEMILDSSQMPSEQALDDNGIQIDSSPAQGADGSTINNESIRSTADEIITNSPKSETGEVNNPQPQAQGLGAKLRGIFGRNNNG